MLEQKSKKRKSGWHNANGVPANSPDMSPHAPLAQLFVVMKVEEPSCRGEAVNHFK
jgi:hypothetical protein